MHEDVEVGAMVSHLRTAVDQVLLYRSHRKGCEVVQTEFCTCGLREAVEVLQQAWDTLLEARAYRRRGYDQRTAILGVSLGRVFGTVVDGSWLQVGPK